MSRPASEIRYGPPDGLDSPPGAARAAWAFQSYPTLLRSGEVPTELRSASGGIDVEHRDARAAIGVMPDGRVIVALTRLDAFGATLGVIPFGLTTPEMAAVMGALGARDAVMLDGGISGQMSVRAADGTVKAWRGTRTVPLALLAY
jgi:exopolysaccharide biosynthesis protein